jgi:HEXXH motif-containing protein
LQEERPRPALAPRDLTIPEPGSTTARDVLSAAIRRLLGDLRELPETHATSTETRQAYRALRSVVARMLERDPGAVASLLRHPTVTVFVRCLRDRAPGDGTDPLVAELVATAFLELANSGALAEPVRVAKVPEDIVCLPGRFAIDARGVGAITFRAGEIVLHGESDVVLALGPGASHPRLTRPFHAIEDDAVLTLVDRNPLAMQEAHPDKEGNAIDLGGRAAGEWVASLRTALEPIAEHMPDLRHDVALYLQQVVPVGYDAEKHLSASYRESIGTVYLTLHPHPMTMTEAIVHEVSHNELNALLELDPLLENAFEPLFTSPVRPDPRPLQGILLAVHAFLPIERLYERMIAAGHPWSKPPSFEHRLQDIRAKNREGAGVLLANARPTETGRALLDEIARLTPESSP